MPSDQYVQLTAVFAAAKLGTDTPLEAQRAGYDLVGSLLPMPEGASVESVELGSVPAERITPVEADPGRTVLYLHGGGYVIGSPSSHRTLAAHLATAARAVTYVADYRLAPEHPFPAAIDDAVEAYRALLDGGTDPARLVVVGDSAGGGLTAALLIRLRDGGHPAPAGAALISPWIDLAGTGASMLELVDVDVFLSPELLAQWAHWYSGDDLSRPLASPLYADLVGLPPLLVHAGEQEVLRDDTLRLVERAIAAGVEVEVEVWAEMCHHWHLFAGSVPEADEAVARMGAWIIAHTS